MINKYHAIFFTLLCTSLLISGCSKISGLKENVVGKIMAMKPADKVEEFVEPPPLDITHRPLDIVHADRLIETRALSAVLFSNSGARQQRIQINSFNRHLLLTGEVSSIDDFLRIENTIRRTLANQFILVTRIINRLELDAFSAIKVNMDHEISAELQLSMMGLKKGQRPDVKIIVSNGKVFFFGFLNADHAQVLSTIARGTEGVDLIEIIPAQ